MEILKQKKLTLNQFIIEKVIDLYSLLQNRFGICLLGPTLSGKSTIIKLLQHTLNRIHEQDKELKAPKIQHRVEKEIINPKAVSMNELFGSIDPVTKSWKDGVLSHCLRTMSENNEPNL